MFPTPFAYLPDYQSTNSPRNNQGETLLTLATWEAELLQKLKTVVGKAASHDRHTFTAPRSATTVARKFG